MRKAGAGCLLFLAALMAAACSGGAARERSEVVVANAVFPSALAFAPDGRLFYTELKTGDIRIVTPQGQLLAQPFAHFDVANQGEWGLLGIALDPDFDREPYVYVYYMEPLSPGVARPVVARLRAEGDRGLEPAVLLGDLPETPPPSVMHVGGHLHFGSDGYLYVSIGDFGGDYQLAGDLSSVRGKLLRVDKRDGSPPPDNPFVGRSGADPRIYAYGLRNSFDFAFQPASGRAYAADNGPDRCDELNLVLPGYDYGWPQAYSGQTCITANGVQAVYNFRREGMQPWQAGSTVAPTGLEFVTQARYADIPEGSLLACEFNTGLLRQLTFAADGSVQGDRVLRQDCRIDIAEAPDGTIYYSNTSEIKRLLP
ncbi:MAG TPA: PQQ-dependent sugar dehydrogenase [Dehalococcoidia bacterium]|nr:PQQ-dependent sugar dehydrogenase [Dehalococcoidia bacterium]